MPRHSEPAYRGTYTDGVTNWHLDRHVEGDLILSHRKAPGTVLIEDKMVTGTVFANRVEFGELLVQEGDIGAVEIGDANEIDDKLGRSIADRFGIVGSRVREVSLYGKARIGFMEIVDSVVDSMYTADGCHVREATVNYSRLDNLALLGTFGDLLLHSGQAGEIAMGPDDMTEPGAEANLNLLRIGEEFHVGTLKTLGKPIARQVDVQGSVDRYHHENGSVILNNHYTIGPKAVVPEKLVDVLERGKKAFHQKVQAGQLI